LWAWCSKRSRLDDVVEQVVRSLEFAVLAKYGFGLAQMFTRSTRTEASSSTKTRRRAAVARAAVAYCRQQLTRVLDLMGVAFRLECRTLTHALIAIAQNRRCPTTSSPSAVPAASRRSVVRRRNAEHILARVDGLMLTGGGDVDPAAVRRGAHATFQAAETGRDAFEIALSRAAVAKGIPFLAICRGMQVLNVAMGGTLIQDIPSQVTGALEHSRAEPRFASRTRCGSRRARSCRRCSPITWKTARPATSTAGIISRCKRGAGFEVTATVARRRRSRRWKNRRPFCVAVQWHPENFWRTGEFRELFQGLVRPLTRAKAMNRLDVRGVRKQSNARADAIR
jgi:putative glutamine amidotransferase